MITIPTSPDTAHLIAACYSDADVTIEPGRMSVHLGAVAFVATIPERRAAS